MPSFRAILALAATTFVALSSAVPIADGTGQALQGVNAQDVANDSLESIKISYNHLVICRRQNQATQLVDIEKTAKNVGQGLEVTGNSGELLKCARSLLEREEPQPLPAVLLQAKAELEAASSKLDTLAKGKPHIKFQDLKVILDEVHISLAGAVASVKLLVGKSPASILTLDGKVWTAADIGQLLISVVVNVWSILSISLRAVSPSSDKAAFTHAKGIADVLAKLLLAIFGKLDAGIFPATRPLVTEVLLKVWNYLHLDGVAAILRNGTA
ncbi:hypothetical protein C0995_009018 [Termitomyces sp. Mi166|nr:hypothetical protein C0995_009018 [Termitomyces sp. Mi166\